MTVSMSSISLSSAITINKKDGQSQDYLTYSCAPTLTDGTGNSQANDMWYSSGVLSSGGAVEFNLKSLSRTFLNSSITQNFQNVKAIYIENTATGVGQYITLTATGSTPFTDFLNGGSGNLKIHPNSCLPIMYPLSGWNTATGAKSIQLNDGGLAATYRIVVLGILA